MNTKADPHTVSKSKNMFNALTQLCHTFNTCYDNNDQHVAPGIC